MNLKSLTHNTSKARVIGKNFPIVFPVATQVPGACNVPRTEGKVFNVHRMQQHAFVATKTPTGKLFPTFLRFAAAPSGHWRSLSTSTHKANNVVNGSTLVQHRSVEHYEAVDVSRFIDQFLFRAANVYGNPKVYHLVIEKCTTFQSCAKLHLI